jgi:hypothetical protein
MLNVEQQVRLVRHDLRQRMTYTMTCQSGKKVGSRKEATRGKLPVKTLLIAAALWWGAARAAARCARQGAGRAAQYGRPTAAAAHRTFLAPSERCGFQPLSAAAAWGWGRWRTPLRCRRSDVYADAASPRYDPARAHTRFALPECHRPEGEARVDPERPGDKPSARPCRTGIFQRQPQKLREYKRARPAKP